MEFLSRIAEFCGSSWLDGRGRLMPLGVPNVECIFLKVFHEDGRKWRTRSLKLKGLWWRRLRRRGGGKRAIFMRKTPVLYLSHSAQRFRKFTHIHYITSSRASYHNPLFYQSLRIRSHTYHSASWHKWFSQRKMPKIWRIKMWIYRYIQRRQLLESIEFILLLFRHSRNLWHS